MSDYPSASDPSSTRSSDRSSELDEFLSRAVDRQVAEQRALRETLAELRDAITELQAAPAPASDVTGELRELRESILPGLQRSVDAAHSVRVMEGDISALRDTVVSVSADIDGIAQALIDLNSGLRDWADGVDRNVRDVRETAHELRELASDPQGRLSLGPALPDGLGVADGEIVDDAAQETRALAKIDERAELDQRVKESIELSLYLADQIDEFDRVIGKLGDLPSRLEGVIAQALKRTLAARGKLDREAETALDEVLATLDEHVETIASSVGGLTESEDAVRKLTLGQVELSSRIESLHSTLVNRLEDIEEARRRSESVLAEAIDRSATGRAPQAAANLKKVTPKRSAARGPAKTISPATKKVTAKSAQKRGD